MSESSFPWEVNVASRYGAPMGRPSDPIESFAGRVCRISQVPFVDGDYDAGGAYWGGGGNPVYCVYTTTPQRVAYVRAANLDEAAKQFPGAFFADTDTREEIIRGIATIFWASGWADHVEEHGCHDLSGCEITAEMPEIPQDAWDHARKLASGVEAESRATLPTLYQRAIDADAAEDIEADSHRTGPERFGECLAYAAMGAGVSWEDDHAEVPGLEVPFDGGTAVCDLMGYAESMCTAEGESDDGE